MGDGTLAHQSSSSTVRRRNSARWRRLSDEGGEGEIDAPQTNNGEGRAQATLTVVVLATAEAAGQRRPWRSDSEAWHLRIEARGHGLVRAAAAHARWGAVGRRAAWRGGRETGGRGEATLSGGRGRARQLSGCAARCPDSGFKPRRRRGTWRPCGSGALPHGPSAARGD
jgi:hypothetical protein